MTPGFGTPPNHDREIRLMHKAIASQNMNQLEALVRKFSKSLGHSKVSTLLAQNVMERCSFEESDWFWKETLPPDRYQQMRSMAVDAMLQSLIEDGLEPGKDFSFGVDTNGDRSIILSEKAHDAIFSHIPAHLQDQLKSDLERYTSPQQQNPKSAAERLEEWLGVPFFDNLERIARERCEGLSDHDAGCYLLAIVEGFGERHPELDAFAQWLFANALPEDRRQQVIEAVRDEESFSMGPFTYIFGDLLKALEREQNVINGEPVLSKEDLRELGKVFAGPEGRLEELAFALEKAERQHREQQ